MNKTTYQPMQTGFAITYQTTVNAPVTAVWDALSNPAVVKQYFFGTLLVTNWQVGQPIEFKGEWQGQPYSDVGTVLEFVPNQKLAFSYLSSWSGKTNEPENYLYVAYEVQPNNEGTTLTITQTNYDEERAKHAQQNWANLVAAMKQLIEAPEVG
jgi:uncharacterized protein YndB with AHSA1/START domain